MIHEGLRNRLRCASWRVRMHQILIADDQHAFRETRQLGICTLDTLDDQRAGGASQHLPAAEAMDMRVIPVQPGRLIRRYAEAVLEGSIRRLNRGFQHIILMANGRQLQAMKMQVGRSERHGPAGAGIIRAGGRAVLRMHRGRRGRRVRPRHG